MGDQQISYIFWARKECNEILELYIKIMSIHGFADCKMNKTDMLFSLSLALLTI